MAFATPTPEMIAEAMVEELPKPAQAKPVEADGAARAAKMLAELLQEAALLTKTARQTATEVADAVGAAGSVQATATVHAAGTVSGLTVPAARR